MRVNIGYAAAATGYGLGTDDYLQQPKSGGTKTFLGSAGFDVHCPNRSFATLCEQAWFVWHKFAQKRISMHVFLTSL